MMQLVANPNVAPNSGSSKEEQEISNRVHNHNKLVIKLVREIASGQPLLESAVKQFDSLTAKEKVAKGTEYEKNMGNVNQVRILVDLMRKSLDGNKSGGERYAQEIEKFDELTSLRDGNIVMSEFNMAFNARLQVLKDMEKPLSPSDTAIKYVAALRKDAEHHPGLRDAHKEALRLVREADRLKEPAPDLHDLQTAVIDSIDLYLATVGEESRVKKDKTHKQLKSNKGNKSKPDYTEETSFFGEHYTEKSEDRGKGFVKGMSGKGKGKGKGGKEKGYNNSKDQGKGYSSGKGTGKGTGGKSKGYNAEATDHKKPNKWPSKWSKSYSSESENGGRGWQSSGYSGSEKSYYKPSYVKATKGSAQYSNAVKKAFRQAKEDVKSAGRDKGWSEDQAEAYFMKAMAKSMELNMKEDAPKATNQYRRSRNERAAAEESDAESSASSRSGWEW